MTLEELQKKIGNVNSLAAEVEKLRRNLNQAKEWDNMKITFGPANWSGVCAPKSVKEPIMALIEMAIGHEGKRLAEMRKEIEALQ